LLLQPTNVEALLLLCMLELSQGKKEGNNTRNDTILDYCVLASRLNPAFPPVLNVMANYIFQQQKSYDAKFSADSPSSTLLVYCDGEDDISVDDTFEIGDITASVVSVSYGFSDGNAVAEVSIGQVVTPTQSNTIVKIIKTSKVLQLALGALNLSKSGSVRSESLYILGKVRHLRGDIDDAFDFYRNSVKEDPNMILAQFEAAKVLFSRKDFTSAYDLFSIILKKYPDDRDTQGFVMLISSILHQEIISVEKIKEFSKFQFVLDLWLVQAHNRHHDANEHSSAIKCYHAAIDIAASTGQPIPAVCLINLSVLYHATGKYKLSLSYLQQGMSMLKSDKSGISAKTMNDAIRKLTAEDFDGFLYEWQDVNIATTSVDKQGNTITLMFDSPESSYLPMPKDVLIVNGIKVEVRSASPSHITMYGPLAHLINEGGRIDVKAKLLHLEYFDFPLIAFNYGRILEDTGRYEAALELYNAILSKTPGFLECRR
jgi:tetratricopeptide (TPR) repeat protein